jgi:hypothetical protein
MKLRSLIGCAGAVLLLTGSSVANDDNGITECRFRSEKIQHRLDQVTAKYGSDTVHANKVREKFDTLHEWCWQRYQGWWDERTKRWRTDHW